LKKKNWALIFKKEFIVKILSIVGARPQFIKSAPVSKYFRQMGVEELIIHTGQHYDDNMSEIFFNELGIPQPFLNLGVGSYLHGKQTGIMLEKIENVLLKEKPNLILVYGDTNSTLAGALAACKLNIPIGHIEAGLRSYNKKMPEEHNRVLTDHCSNILFCPTQTALDNLKIEGLCDNTHLVGDTMYDALLQFLDLAEKGSNVLDKLNLTSKKYILATIHRPYNTDDQYKLNQIILALSSITDKVILPLHPRTREKIKEFGISVNKSKLTIIDPVGYVDMIVLENNSKAVVTDSGGVQKEAYFCGVPCVTVRPETEWVETIEDGWNVLANANSAEIIDKVENLTKYLNMNGRSDVFGDGYAHKKIFNVISKQYGM